MLPRQKERQRKFYIQNGCVCAIEQEEREIVRKTKRDNVTEKERKREREKEEETFVREGERFSKTQSRIVPEHPN